MTESTKHDRIFLQVCDDPDNDWVGEVTWCEDRIHDEDVEYIRADLVNQQLAAEQAVIERMQRALGDIAGSKSLTATPTQFYRRLQKLAGDANRTHGKTPIEALRDRDRKRDAALLRTCISPNNPMLQAHLEELARLRESGEWEPKL